ncbi:oculocerebrorenal Lowe syndrome protein [Trypanosoma cruzi]|nr:oculocerebrorenal Lowe syndrome protein [Trypanosoma cruzi]
MIPGLPPAFDVECNRMEDVFASVKSRTVGKDGNLLSPEESWVQRELQYYENLYTEQQELTVCLVTFNVACKKPPANLAALISLKMAEDKNRPVDLIMVSLQEVDMSASAMLKEETEASTPWVVSTPLWAQILGHQATPHIMPFHPSNLLASYYVSTYDANFFPTCRRCLLRLLRQERWVAWEIKVLLVFVLCYTAPACVL